MNRRVLVIIIVVIALGGALALTMLGRPKPSVTESRTTPSAERAPAPTAPAPAASSTAPAPRPATEPRRRAPAASPAASATPAAAAPDPGLVTLHVDSDVPGAQVFVDRHFLGPTPLTTTEVKAGSHRLNVSAPGYEGIAQSLELTPGSRDVVIKLREVRLEASVAVIHKHRMGSCNGRLVATPQGVRYETTNKDDAFRSGLLDLETFEVDYLEKNLRVKPKQGKRYDFTDPEGNADRLFVFHRDVDKARERLRKGDPPAQP